MSSLSRSLSPSLSLALSLYVCVCVRVCALIFNADDLGHGGGRRRPAGHRRRGPLPRRRRALATETEWRPDSGDGDCRVARLACLAHSSKFCISMVQGTNSQIDNQNENETTTVLVLLKNSTGKDRSHVRQ